MHIVSVLSPNNKLQIKRYRLADGYCRPRTHSDPQEARESEYQAVKFDLARYNTKVIEKAFEEKTYKLKVSTSTQISILPLIKPSNTIEEKYISVPYCTLPTDISLLEVKPDGSTSVERTDYFELARKKTTALDLLKKSQQSQKSKHSSWGKPQSPKEFRWQGGQKIMEGGAVIDRFCGQKNAHMVTLTLPGTGRKIYDALARWSGWVVNRICQVIRRANTPQNPIYWFFVWEHQKRGALHMHWCVGWKVHEKARRELCEKIKDKWFHLLFEIGKKESLDMYRRPGFSGTWAATPEVWKADIQQIKKSVAAYFSKYCEKNTQLNKERHNTNAKAIPDQHKATRKRSNRSGISYPTRYWGSSKSIKAWCNFLTRRKEIITDSTIEAERACSRLRETLVVGFNIKSLSVNDFEVIEPYSGNVICSGTTETYTFDPITYTSVWLHACNEFFEDFDRIHAFPELKRRYFEFMESTSVFESNPI